MAMKLMPLSPQRYARALRRRTPMTVKRFARKILEIGAPPAIEPPAPVNRYAELYEQQLCGIRRRARSAVETSTGWAGSSWRS